MQNQPQEQEELQKKSSTNALVDNDSITAINIGNPAHFNQFGTYSLAENINKKDPFVL